MMYGVGMIDSALAWDYASAYAQNEFAGHILQVVKGIRISEAEFCYDVIKQVGPGGEYITHPHTFKNFRSLTCPELCDRNTRERWEANGSKEFAEVAYEKAMAVLEKAEANVQPESVQQELDRIYADYEARVSARKAEKKKK
jgi:trimethylamine:corrinoid methyltransferase-like protein